MSPNRKGIETFGRRGQRAYVRVFTETAHRRPVVRVRWSEAGGTKTVTFEHTRKGIAEAKAYGAGVHDRLTERRAELVAPVTVQELYEKYVTAKVDSWRVRTLENKNARWRKFILFAGKATLAAHITRETLDGFKRAMVANGHSVNQVAAHIECVTAVFRWGVERDLIPPTKVATYRAEFSKDAKRQVQEMGEYSRAERDQLIAALNPKDSRQWRAWALTVLLAYCGPRIRAALHLEWRDIDLEGWRIHWRPELDKMGEDRWQPMPEPVRDVFWVALGWAQRDGYDGVFVFYAPAAKRRAAGEPYTYQAYNYALREAETRAGIAHMKYRAAHGHRRGIAGDIYAVTRSTKDAANWIGDKSIRVVDEKYLLEREEELRRLAAIAAAPEAGPKPEQQNGTKQNGPAGEGEAMGVNRDSARRTS